MLPKVLAVVLAAFVWLQVVNEQNPLTRQTVEVPVEVLNQPKGWKVLSVSPDRVKVTLGGRARTFERTDLRHLEATVDLSATNLAPGVHSLRPVVSAPPGLEVLEISPATVQVDVDVIVTRDVPVSVRVSGEPHEDFQQSVPFVSVARTTVSGPKRLVDRVEVATADIDVTGAQVDVVRRVRLVPRDAREAEVTGLSLEPAEAEARVPMIALPPSRILLVQVPQEGSPAPGYRVDSITVEPRQVKVRVPEGRQVPSVIRTKAVNLSGRTSDFSTVVPLDLPAGVTALDYVSAKVTVKIVEDIVTKRFSNIGVVVKNRSPGLMWKLSSESVDVTVEGRRDLVDKVREDDIIAYVDAEGLPEGEYVVAVEAELEREVSGVKLTTEPDTVELKLIRF